MAEEFQGPSGPHGLKADFEPVDPAEGEAQEPEDIAPGLFGSHGAAPALEDKTAE